MVRKLFQFMRPLSLLFLVSMVLGFRVHTAMKWDITKDDPTLWVKFDEEDLVREFKETEFNKNEDPLAVYPKDQQMIELIKLIFADYNDISTSFVRLAFYPTSVETGSYSSLDSPFSGELAAERTITVKNAGAVGLAAGAAMYKDNGQFLDSCRITMAAATYKTAMEFKTTLTHELGHCLGLAHAHADRDAIMSYNAKSGQHTLGFDDKMGITFFYPEEESYSKEAATFGLGCERAR